MRTASQERLVFMYFSVCCQAKTQMAYEGTVCTQCWRICREYNPPCTTCGSDGPCSCGNFDYLQEQKRGTEILDAVAPLLENKQMYPNYQVGQKINPNSEEEMLTEEPF